MAETISDLLERVCGRNTTPKQLKKVGYRPRIMIGFWNVRTLLKEGAQTHQNSRFLHLENLFTQNGYTLSKRNEMGGQRRLPQPNWRHQLYLLG